MSIHNFTPDELIALRREHTPSDIPPCRVCGGEMVQVGNPFDGRVAYVCRAVAENHEPGWIYHYRNSKTIYQANPQGNPLIIRLIDTIEEYRRVFAELEAIR